MKINIIGSGSIGSKDINASVLIDEHILIDVPNGIIKHLKRLGYDIFKIDTILITHLHGDHFFDLPFLMLEKYFNQDKRQLKIICPQGTQQKIKQLFEIGFPNDFAKVISNINIDFLEQFTEKSIKVDNLAIEIKNVKHGLLKPTFGYILTIDNKKVAVSGDSSYCKEIDYLVEKSDISILDMSLPDKGNKSHMGYKDIKNICQKYQKKQIIAIHMHDTTKTKAQSNHLKNLIIPKENQELII